MTVLSQWSGSTKVRPVLIRQRPSERWWILVVREAYRTLLECVLLLRSRRERERAWMKNLDLSQHKWQRL